jgi:hypothetical protein
MKRVPLIIAAFPFVADLDRFVSLIQPKLFPIERTNQKFSPVASIDSNAIK